MPYISASIVVQLLGVTMPYFQKLQKDGDSGRKKLNQITRYLTIALTSFQSIAYLSATIPPEAILVSNKLFFTISSVIILVSGTIFCMWLGEKCKRLNCPIYIIKILALPEKIKGSLLL